MKSGQIIKMILKEKGLKQIWLAKELKISPARLNMMLDRDIKFEEAIRICDALKISVDELSQKQKNEMSSANANPLNSSHKSDNAT
ncbi:MAG: helix-turn-helix domain-containing protein [Candidatus Caccovivens sp.]